MALGGFSKSVGQQATMLDSLTKNNHSNTKRVALSFSFFFQPFWERLYQSFAAAISS